MPRRNRRSRTHLRLVSSTDLPLIVTDPAARAEFEQLTQALIDAALEIMDLADGDVDLEATSDDMEDDDGI